MLVVEDGLVPQVILLVVRAVEELVVVDFHLVDLLPELILPVVEVEVFLVQYLTHIEQEPVVLVSSSSVILYNI